MLMLTEWNEFEPKQDFHKIYTKNWGGHERICMHETCSECNGRGIKANGMQCVHYISCPCPKCTPYFL